MFLQSGLHVCLHTSANNLQLPMNAWNLYNNLFLHPAFGVICLLEKETIQKVDLVTFKHYHIVHLLCFILCVGTVYHHHTSVSGSELKE